MNVQPQYITNAQGEKISVILSLSDYEELLEDLEDLAVIAERRNEIAQPFEQVLAELGYEISH